METLFKVENISKTYGRTVTLKNINFSVKKGEIYCLLGPSGCGKSTLLRIISGLEYPDKGKVYLNQMDITPLTPQERPINIMFQNYALFPHMNVYENIAYGLKRKDLSDDKISEKVFSLLKLLKLEQFMQRMPQSLSGGQKQRTALARSLAREPVILLLDEPMSALDKKLREETQHELKSLQKKLGITIIFVTHDHEEAITLADKIAILNHGEIVQEDKPQRLYNYPKNIFVADFFGDANLFSGKIYKKDKNNIFYNKNLQFIFTLKYKKIKKNIGDKLIISILPEEINLVFKKNYKSDCNYIPVKLVNIFFKKNFWNVIVKIKNYKEKIRVFISSKEKNKLDFSKKQTLYLEFKKSSGIMLNED